ncbi:T9SS type B sorting domain-containing protein [Winogradskyella thalassocola]|uniref:Gliding motility-associated C-terminal domain-containing protein n=1 Tax=Winogradskyella thalassocola TaxID=262004 RepID=A0A1G8EW41_9FLAO|nr:choice-of-anchor L domain-containing protein [Winogradskyella thalassocola]SDH74133.1 gliding motility-associated C-terminal domain-containing protein [Winogradskyella thalassocola]
MKAKSIYLFLFLFVYINYSYAQQITTDNSQQPNELIQNLVGSDCVTVSNVSSPINGSINNVISYGTFDKSTSNFPLQSGILLSTGRVSSAGNSFNSQNLNDGNIDWLTDPDILNVLGIEQTLNATTIEFDFSSANSFVSFNYLFASDEYQQEFPCNFQDVFAILIKRAGTTDPYVNIAVVPETTTEISTNTIHPNITGFCEAQNEDYFQGYNNGDTNFNGRTEVLTARTDIIPNETYHIKILIADHIDQRFDSAVFIEAEGFGNSINLGPDQSICGSDLTLNAEIDNVVAIYTWFLNGNPIIGENNSTLNVDASGTYDVEISIPSNSGNCLLTDSIEIEIIPFQDAAPIDTINICDPAPSDGVYQFDFTEKNDEIYASLPSTNYIITYHLSEDDAQNNSNPIIGIYENTDSLETIFVRIESLNGDCLQLGSFNLNVKDSPSTLEFTIEVCNGEIFESTFTELSALDRTVSNYEFDTTVTYYLTENDAINAENAISDFPDLEQEPPRFFARVESVLYDCSSVVPVNFSYTIPPDIDRTIINLCIDPMYSEPSGNDTIDYNSLTLTYNIDDLISDFEAQHPELIVAMNLEILPHPDYPIVHFSTPSFVLPISVKFPDEYCRSFTSVVIHKNLVYNLFGRDKTITECDDPSNDGFIDIDLAELSEEYKNGYDDINLVFYETEQDRTNLVNPLDQNSILSVADSQSIFMQASYGGCSYDSKFTVNIEPIYDLDPIIVDYCGNLDPITNHTTISIAPLKDIYFLDLNVVGSVNFYLSYEDAKNQTNEITESYNIPGDQQEFFVRVVNIFWENSCPSISTLQVNITTAIEASDPEPLIICDDDQDGSATINLESVIPELSGGSSNLSFSFFETYEDAVNDVNPIINPNHYTTESRDVFIRGEIETLECFTVFTYNIQIYANPQLSTIEDYIYCAIDLNDTSGFLFVDKDTDIIDGQNNMQVLYFETENEALNNINPIDKNTAYLASSNPQTIFVRLENEAQNSCFKVAPMHVEVRQAPLFNYPSDVFECDVDKTGFATTNLIDKVTEINSGSTTELNISFHLTPLNAEVGANAMPLIYTTTSNPQLIYTRIENINTGCVDIATFNINTLSLPEVQYNKKLTACGNNNNYTQDWNLTQIELEVLQGRQYNIGFTYFETEEDLNMDTNPILNPGSYTNTSNPQTLFAKVTNATTGCFDAVPFELIINQPPQINPFGTYNICENAENRVDLIEINELLMDDTYNIFINYFSNEADAEANENALDSNYIHTNTTETLYTRVEYSTTHCYIVYPFQLVINPIPIAHQPNPISVCDDDFDGLVEIDLSEQNAAILGGQNPNDFFITYYNSEINAIEGNQPINTTHITHTNEIIFVRLENNITGCYAITQFSTTVQDLPFVSIEDQVICSNNIPLIVTAETNNPTDSYLWSTGATSSYIQINDIGTYSVTVTNQFGCENTSIFNVSESESATIDVVETIDFSDPNNITVTVTGIGNYLYQLNNGLLQASNIFQNVPIGYNTLTIIDQNGCASITKDVLVIDTPKHMTPNNDGDFDTWHIAGVEMLPGTVIHIYDNYGKLLTVLTHNSPGWDGTYNGKKMPAKDYWFVADVIQNGKQFQVKGHFALRR